MPPPQPSELPPDPGLDGLALGELMTRIEQGFRSTQQGLRDQVLSVTSTDGRLVLRVNGEGLAVGVNVEETLLADGIAAVESAVMEAVNNAAISIHALTTEAFQLATELHLGLALPDVEPPVAPNP